MDRIDKMGRIDRMGRMPPRDGELLAPGAGMKRGNSRRDATVPGSRSPLSFRLLARATVPPPESSSSSCPSCPSCLMLLPFPRPLL